jgi:N-acetylglutamate synthase-like GNAT family acetyltransferase
MSAPGVLIEPARREDFDAIAALLAANSLPLEGLADHLDAALVARQDGRIVGAAALEVYKDGGLLRSVVVARALQGSGLGRRLVEAVLAHARERRLPAVYLLTTTAALYFPKLGFEAITRAEVPAGVQQSVEFRSACPASATVMRITL